MVVSGGKGVRENFWGGGGNLWTEPYLKLYRGGKSERTY